MDTKIRHYLIFIDKNVYILVKIAFDFNYFFIFALPN